MDGRARESTLLGLFWSDARAQRPLEHILKASRQPLQPAIAEASRVKIDARNALCYKLRS